eukprot:10370802-Lingulodinium_polyedra.AAC.1
MDATYQTNLQGLVLTAVGPAGLVLEGAFPTMRWLPGVFMLSCAEDASAYAACVRTALTEHAKLVEDAAPIRER